jgi:hypothetical protein
MRRLSLSWLLSLLLVFAQHGAVLHELGHLGHASHPSGATLTELQPQDNGLCSTCEAYAQVANPAAGGAVDLPACPPAFTVLPGACFQFHGADAPTARSRGPPLI